MSQIFRFSPADGINVTMHCASRNTRNGFAHDCEIFVNDCFFARGTCHYLNRTWECYIYQSVILHTVQTAIDDRIRYLKMRYKNENNISRLTKAHQAAFACVLDNDSDMLMLSKLKRHFAER